MTITLKFAKEELKCSLGLMFLGEFLDEVNLSLEEVGSKMEKNPFKLLPKMIHRSARTQFELDNIDDDLTLIDVINLIESDGGVASPQVTKFIQEWTKSLTNGVPKSPAKEGDEEEKK